MKWFRRILLVQLVASLFVFQHSWVKQDTLKNIEVVDLRLDATHDTIKTMADNVKSTVVVWSTRGLGSGFYIAENYIVTNSHVVQSKMLGNTILNPAVFITNDGLQYSGTVVAINTTKDVALIYTPTKGIPVVTYNQKRVAVGDFHYSLGSNSGEYKTAKTGNIQATSNPVLPSTFITSALLEPGFSGGGAFDKNNVLIGINVAIWTNLVNRHSYIIKYADVKNWVTVNMMNHMGIKERGAE